MQNNPNIENNETNVSSNRQFGVFSLYSFTRYNPQITYVLVTIQELIIEMRNPNVT